MPVPSLSFNPATGRYRNVETGRFVPRPTVRRALEESLANLQRRTDTLADDLRAGRISLDEWRQEMRLTIKQVNMAAIEISVGGRAQMTQADYGEAGRIIRTEYGYLESWVNQIKAGLPIDNRMEPRARQYLVRGRTTFIDAETDAMRGRGFDEIRSRLHPAEHCAQCLAEAARGFVPISSHVPIGQRQCRHNDRCTVEYRNSRTGEVRAA